MNKAVSLRRLPITIVQMNINTWNNLHKLQSVQLLDADILLLQETQLKKGDTEKAKKEAYGYKTIFSPLPNDEDHKGGTAILVKKTLNCKLREVELEGERKKAQQEGRLTIGELVFPSTGIHAAETIKIGSVYAPSRPEQRKQFFAQVSPELNILARTGHLLMGGDHNEEPQLHRRARG